MQFSWQQKLLLNLSSPSPPQEWTFRATAEKTALSFPDFYPCRSRHRSNCYPCCITKFHNAGLNPEIFMFVVPKVQSFGLLAYSKSGMAIGSYWHIAISTFNSWQWFFLTNKSSKKYFGKHIWHVWSWKASCNVTKWLTTLYTCRALLWNT